MAKDDNRVVVPGINEVHLAGRVSAAPEERTLPSGDTVVTCRLVVPRDRVMKRPDGRRGQTVDVFDCAAWTARARRAVAGWQAGDLVSVRGAVRRRFYRAGQGTAARVEIEVRSARRRRAAA